MIIKKLALLVGCIGLVSCATHHATKMDQMSANTTKTTQTTVAFNATEGGEEGGGNPIGGSLRKSMDQNDRSKLAHALDKAPGKPTRWTNQATGTVFTVTPIKAETIGGNHFCRTYSVTAVTGENTQSSGGTACVNKGAWSEV